MSTTAYPQLNERKLPPGFSMAGLTFVLAALSWMGPFSIDTYLPSIPAIGESLGAPTAAVQQTMTAFLFFFALMSLWHGAISDAYGRRRLTLLSLAIFLAASVGCALSTSVQMLMFFRALQGTTVGAGMIIGRAVVRDLFDGAAAQRLMSHVATIFTIAPVLGPVLGGWFQVWFGWRSIFVFMAGMAAFLLLSCWKFLPETLPAARRQRLNAGYLARSYWKVMTQPAFLMASASLSLVNAGFFIYIMGAPVFLMTHLGLKETQFLYLFLPMAVGMVIGAWISGRCAGHLSGEKTIMVGYVVMIVGALANLALNLALPPMIPWSLVPLFVYVTGMSIAMPSLTLITLDLFPSQRGLAASCQGFLSLAGNSAVSAFVALVWGTTLSLALTMVTMLALGMVTIVLYARFMKRAPQAE
ncbi:MAG: multidrug effflux MFS transporter [Acidobacteriota bacterium]|jgi:DHA1 family bicyclomycin/chloramphenicol resistance-like MFS transporter|nr:multidrug effflux MFS transporter [Acidobacteriota bacterium]